MHDLSFTSTLDKVERLVSGEPDGIKETQWRYSTRETITRLGRIGDPTVNRSGSRGSWFFDDRFFRHATVGRSADLGGRGESTSDTESSRKESKLHLVRER
jgi:hypothetical protein